MAPCQGLHLSICTPICRSQAYFFQTCNFSAKLQKRQMKAKSILSSKEPLFQQDLFSLTYTELAETCRFTFRRYYIQEPCRRKHHLKMCFSITDIWWFQNRIYSGGVGRGCLEQMQFLTVSLPALQSWDWVKLQLCQIQAAAAVLAELYNHTDCPGLGTDRSSSPGQLPRWAVWLVQAVGVLHMKSQGTQMPSTEITGKWSVCFKCHLSTMRGWTSCKRVRGVEGSSG